LIASPLSEYRCLGDPLPRPEDARPFWEGTARGELLVVRVVFTKVDDVYLPRWVRARS